MPIDIHLAKKLKSGKRRDVLRRRRLLEHHFRTKGLIQRVRPEAAGIQRPGDELPERLEILERRPIRVVMMGRAVMHIRGQEQEIAHLLRPQETQ
ncbi:hypothetical protein D3C79_1006630 [compost metagenome]